MELTRLEMQINLTQYHSTRRYDSAANDAVPRQGRLSLRLPTCPLGGLRSYRETHRLHHIAIRITVRVAAQTFRNNLQQTGDDVVLLQHPTRHRHPIGGLGR